VQVWILEDGGGRNKKRTTWVLRYKIEAPRQEPLQGIAWPHVIHGEHVLTTRARGGDRRVSLHAHRLSEARTERTPPSIGLYDDCRSLRTFAYVETTEPLALYGCDGGDIGDDEEWSWIWTFDVDGREGRWRLKLLNPWLHNFVVN
jgi:hypothetical protein